jgi:hypothetical protein
MAFLAKPLSGLPARGDSADIVLGDGVLHVRSVLVEAPAPAAAELPPPPPVEDPDPDLPLPPDPPASVDPLRGARLSYSEIAALGEPVQIAGGGRGNRAFGERFHAAIEAVDWRRPVLGVEELAPADRLRAENLFGAVRDGAVGGRLRAAIEVCTERPFLYEMEGTLFEGVVDVWAREADGTVLLVDWKTGTGEQGEDAFALQQAIYGLAALLAGEARVETIWCLLEHDGAVIRRVLGQVDVSELAARVRSALTVEAPTA